MPAMDHILWKKRRTRHQLRYKSACLEKDYLLRGDAIELCPQ
jgi:hypothetical protein